MSGSSRYNGPGAALRGQPRVPRQRSRPRGDDHDSIHSPDTASPRPFVSASSHRRQWSDASSLQGGSVTQSQHSAQSYLYSSNHSPYMGPASGSPTSPPPSSDSPYFSSSDQQSYGSSQRHQQYPSPQSRVNQYPNGSNGAGQRPGVNGYNSSSNYDQSPMMSPTTPDSWRSPPGPRGYPSQNAHYTPAIQYRQQPSQKSFSTTSSVSNDDHGGRQGRPLNHPYDYDSDDYYNRQGGRPSPGYGTGQMHDQGQGRHREDRGGRGHNHSTSITSNSSSVIAARRERNERMGQNQRAKPSQADEWLNSPTGTEHETEILPWSDDEAIVTKAVRSPPLGYSTEKTLPPLPGWEAQQLRTMDSDKIKVEVGEATTVIPTANDGSGFNFIKNISPIPPPPVSRYNNLPQVQPHGTQSITGVATSLRAAALSSEKSKDQELARQEQVSKPQRPFDRGANQTSLDDMISSLEPTGQDGRQQAIDSWRTSPPLRPREDDSFTSMKNKRRSSLPDKFVPNWNENAQNWRSSIGQRRPSWMASSKGIHDDHAENWDKIDTGDLKKFPTSMSQDKAATPVKRLSDQSSHHRRSGSWSSRPSISRSNSAGSNKDIKDRDEGKPPLPSTTRRRDSFVSSLSRSRSRSRSRSLSLSRSPSRSRSPLRQSRDLKPRGSFSRSRSNSLHSRSGSHSRSRADRHSRYSSLSRSRSRSISRSRSRSPYSRASIEPENVTRGADSSVKGNDTSRFSWQSAGGAPSHRRSWESTVSGEAPKSRDKMDSFNGTSVAPQHPLGEAELSDYESEYGTEKDGGADAEAHISEAEVRKPLTQQGNSKALDDSDTDSIDSPPLKVQYGRRNDDGDDESFSSKHPVSIISTFNLPPATSPTSPPRPPPLPSHYPSAIANGGGFSPPPVPQSPPLGETQNQSLMTAITTVSIEATTSTMLSSRVSVESFRNVPGNTDTAPHRGGKADTNTESGLETDAESDAIKQDRSPIQTSYVSMTSTSGNERMSSSSTPMTPLSNPLSITTSQLRRNESSTSSISVVSARSARSFVSTSSSHSISSLLSGSPPPQRAPPPIPSADSAASGATIGSGLFGGKRTGSGGSARGVRSGLSKQIMPPVIPLPPGPPPEVSGSKPSYGIIPPPIPSSLNGPLESTSDITQNTERNASVSASASSAIQIQMLADEDQSKSQFGAITLENDERLMTRLNNRIAQLEKELEFAQQDLEASQDDVLDLQSKVRELENELDETSKKSSTEESERPATVSEEFKSAKESWEQERAQLLQDLENLRKDHQFELESSLERERLKLAEELERLASEHATAMESKAAEAAQERDILHDEHRRAIEDQKQHLESEHKQSTDGLLSQLESLTVLHAEKLEEQRLEHENRAQENQREFNAQLLSIQEGAAKNLESVNVTHQQRIGNYEQRLEGMEKSLTEISSQRDQAINDLSYHKKETEKALDRLEIVLAEDKKTHALLIQSLEQKSRRLEERIAELESEKRELMQDNVQIVEEMQKREELWAQERAQLRSGSADENEAMIRLQEAHDQLAALTESKRQADSQFQGIVKGLLREASANKKEIQEHRNLLEQERNAKEEVMQRLELIQQERHSLQHEKQNLEQEKQDLQQEKQNLQQEKQDLQQEKQNIQQEMQIIQQEVQGLEQTMQGLQQEKDDLQHEAQSLLREKELANEKWASVESNRGDMEAQLEALKKSGDEALLNIQNELQDRVRQLQQDLESEREKSLSLESTLEQGLSKAKGELQQEQFTWKTRLDQVEAALKTKEGQVRRLEQEANATVKIQNDLVQSMERDAANSIKKLEAKMKEMELSFAEEKEQLQRQMQQDFAKRHEQDSAQKEASLHQQLESIHKQELEMAKQDIASRHDQQLRSLRQQHEAALAQSNLSLKQQSAAIDEQLEKLRQQIEQERSEKEVAVKDRTFLERKMTGHDRRQKQLEESLAALQQQLDQSRSKFGKDLQEVERTKLSLERKLSTAKEDVKELNKIRDELENDRDGLRQEVQRLKKASLGKDPSAGANAGAWEAEKRHLQEQVRKLEDEVQIMLEKNMNLTIELTGPRPFKGLHNFLKKFTPWQIIVGALTTLYAAHHADLLLGLTPAEPEKKMFSRRYTRGYTRGLWIFSALDAGFFTSQNIRPKVLRDTMSAIFSVYYLFFPKRAVEKNNIMLQTITATHMRRSWEKMMHPLIRLMTWINAPRLGVRKQIKLKLSKEAGDYSDSVITLTIFFKGSEEELAKAEAIILDIPGGGFVAMHPSCHADYLMAWAGQTGMPIVSIDYKKAPEHPFPHGLFECFDVYKSIVTTKGASVGLSGTLQPRIALAGDSAGGTLAASVMNMIIEYTPVLPRPCGLLLVYPCMLVGLDFWISNSDLAVIEEEIARGPIPSDNLKARPGRGDGMTLNSKAAFMDDQVLGSSFLRALMVMYIGGDTTIDHKSDYLLSPIHTPNHILAQYPRTYILSGEKDPLVDDSIIFMAKLRRAKRAAGIDLESDTLRIISGVSHAFLQMTGIVPEMRDLVKVLGEELVDIVKPPNVQQESSWGEASSASIQGEGKDSADLVQVHVHPTAISNPRQISPFVFQWEQQVTRDAVTIYEHRRVAYLDQLGIHDD
ncbi:hypothetical protein BGX21_006950 [Mortierella sp. AD011]|nr:hypothetical protein BGX21_006950 [Mortierella sp. AD011]